ncbi:hypothetical protein STSP_06700 [Streptomyces jeddahensis]|uniref:Transposase IS204/IS1001/IS1096/IS1165 helix-turn-helix domain-containing protein n=2 Tax=Streptomyces jeddahensis TaxID=1716141 RepID=A0A177HZ64_9ACTN|nr:hypothetical protein STSP_06700 [Streptomyces jeddahensis]
MRVRVAAERRIRDAGFHRRPARDLHLSWPTVMHAFRDQAREVVDAPLPEADAVGVGEDPPGQAALGTRP